MLEALDGRDETITFEDLYNGASPTHLCVDIATFFKGCASQRTMVANGGASAGIL